MKTFMIWAAVALGVFGTGFAIYSHQTAKADECCCCGSDEDAKKKCDKHCKCDKCKDGCHCKKDGKKCCDACKCVKK